MSFVRNIYNRDDKVLDSVHTCPVMYEPSAFLGVRLIP